MSTKRVQSILISLLSISIAICIASASWSQQQLAIQGGRIIPMVGQPIDDGVILIREGKIDAVGKDLSIPLEAQVIDASGKTILPGFVESHSSAAMSQANEQNQNVPYLSVVDTIDPIREYFEESRRNGVTTVAVVPGNSTMLGGQAAIIKTAGGYVDEMILKRHAGLKISLRPTGGQSRMSHLARLRKELEKARRALEEGDEQLLADVSKSDESESSEENGDDESDDESSEEESDQDRQQTTARDAALQLAAMKKLLSGDFPAFIYCDNGMDVIQAIKLTKQYDLKTILVVGRNAYRAIDEIAESQLPVILDATLVFWRTDPRTGEDEKIVLPEIFRDKQVPVTFQVSDSSQAAIGTRYFWYQAATAVKYGTPIDEALKAITLRPAEILGVSELIGSIQPGKDADLVIFSGDPLTVSTWVETTIVNGKVVYERDKDQKLQKLLQPDKS